MKVYYDKDANLRYAKNKIIAIIGYGIIGRACALNLRSSGFKVIIGNKHDKYLKRAEKDGFEVTNIAEVVRKASIIFILIPDQAQLTVYNTYIAPNLKMNDFLIFAHGFSIYYKQITPPANVDICLLAPRMPGKPIRDYYLAGGGVPAFGTIHQNASGKAKQIMLSLAKGIGYTKAGLMDISFKEEVEIDLFIEHFLLPIIIRSIRLSFDNLVKAGFTPESTLMELYASGEIGELLLMAAKNGIYDVWKNNASPTCQFGIYHYSDYILPENEARKKIKKVIKDINDGTFVNALSKEAYTNYKNLKKYDKENEKALITKTQEKLDRIIKFRLGESKR